MASSNNTYDAQASTNYKEAFALFDKRGTQRVSLDSLGDLLRACGQNPTLAEIRELEKNVGGDCTFPPRSHSPSSMTQRSDHRGCFSVQAITTPYM
jgi:Ca2+-binding EF-hand superfamily protein